MKKLLSIIALVSLCFIAFGQLAPTNKPARVMVSWHAGPEPDLAGYKVYHGTNSRVYDVVIPVTNTLTNGVVQFHTTNLICSNFVRGVTYHFAATAYNTAGLESDFSEEAVLFITEIPAAPTGIYLTNVIGMVTIQATMLRGETPTGPWNTAMIVAPYREDPEGQAFFKMMMGIDYLVVPENPPPSPLLP